MSIRLSVCRRRISLRQALFALLPFAALAVGCDRSAGVEEYRVPKPRQIDQVVRRHVSDTSSALPPRETVPGTMLVALVPHENHAWFFRALVSSDDAADLAPRLREFAQTVRFDAQRDAVWNLPANWRAERHDSTESIRWATLYVPHRAGSPREFEVWVTQLPIVGSWNEYLLDNVNRWRGQMGAQPIAANAVERQYEEIPSAASGGRSALWFQIDGVMSAPAAPPRAANESNPARPPAQPPRVPGPGLAYQIPAGWEQGNLRPAVKAVFNVREGEQRVEITVTDLSAINQWVPNVNLWRGQVGLRELDAEAIDAATAPIALADGTPGNYIVLDGPASERPQTILAVMAVKGPLAWFVKLRGDTALAKREQLNFEGFVKSLRIGD